MTARYELDAATLAAIRRELREHDPAPMPSAEFRVLVTGSRNWADAQAIYVELFKVEVAHPRLVVVHGACPTGADAIADLWARSRGPYVRAERHPADWDRDGKPAGPRRNQEMVDLGADLCLAFLMPDSRGTKHCAAAAERANIPTRRFQGV